GCIYCQTGALGFSRNLTQAEILGQLIALNDYLSGKKDKCITNIVFMGMGEALSNFDALMPAIGVIMADDGFQIGGRKITISTAGVVPNIKRLMQQDLNVGLAISLNAFNNEQRSRLMPINRRYPIEELVAVAAEYFKKTGRRVTFEYVCIANVNDTDEAAAALIKILGPCTCKINLIGLNPTNATTPYKAPAAKRLETFAELLRKGGLAVTIRAGRGRDIAGACGQLAGSISGN
ncbi:MAG: 23S rRNA (adenine(2503)-C(2))-methyltransferase RlmN, partial [Chitinivibrionales bacterium]|nr:23S rRNA (adenine(2503)-C(2))-methyltransferase RlmN [Chitinivibrionales bacterium]